MVEGFAAAGFQVFSPEDKTEAIASSLDEVIQNNFNLCFILERYALRISGKIRELEEKTYPAIVVVPDYRKDFGLAAESLKEIVIRAIGTESIESIQR